MHKGQAIFAPINLIGGINIAHPIQVALKYRRRLMNISSIRQNIAVMDMQVGKNTPLISNKPTVDANSIASPPAVPRPIL